MDNLINAKKEKYYKIKGISEYAPIKIKRRILELGFTRGQSVKVVRKSLLAKSYLVEIRGFTLTIRRDIASFIEIGWEYD